MILVVSMHYIANQLANACIKMFHIKKEFSSSWLPLTGYFLKILCKPQRWLCMKIIAAQQFLAFSDQTFE